MTSEQVKNILDSLVTKEERDFSVRLCGRKTKRCMAIYHSGHREIAIYNGLKSQTTEECLRILALGLHELSHHIDHKQNKHAWYALRLSGRRRSLHGATFVKTLDSPIRQFNRHYSAHLKGLIVFNKRRPTRPPRFEKFVKGRPNITQTKLRPEG